MLTTLVALLAAATIAVPLTRKAGFGSVLGYLLAGIVIGPAGLRLVTDVEQIASVSSLGVVMLLFILFPYIPYLNRIPEKLRLAPLIWK